MGLMQKIDDIYADTTLEKRFIAKSLFWVCLVVSMVFIVGTMLNLKENNFFSAVAEAFFAVFLLVSLVLLFKKRVEIVSKAVIFMALFIGFLIGVVSVEKSMFASYVSLVYMVPTISSLGLVGTFRQTVIIGILVVVSIVYSYIINVLPAAAAQSIPVPATLKLLLAPALLAIVIVVFTSMVVYSSKSIIGKLSESEAETKSRLSRISHFFQSLKETANIGEDLNHSAEQSLNLTGTISKNLNSMENSIENLQNQIVYTQKIHESIDKAGQIVKESSQVQSSAVAQSSAAVEQMASSILEMSHTAESRRELVEQLVQIEKDVAGKMKIGQKSFVSVKNSTNEMLNVVAVISDIAERTNLLAMNAAIEAAHAGNTGRGFAVVAQEIRKLAVEAGTNSQKIKTIIESSVQGIDKAVDINSKVGDEFHAVSTQIQEIDIALSEIITGFSELAAGTNEITKVVENLAVINNSVQTSVNEVTGQLSQGRESVDQISSATEEIKLNMQDIAGNSQSIQSEAEHIYSIGKNNEEHIRMLEENLV